MTKKQVQALLSAGVFSAALLSGAAYADQTSTKTDGSAATTPAASTDQSLKNAPSADASPAPAPKLTDASTDKPSKKTTSTKSSATHDCGGANGCGGKGQ